MYLLFITYLLRIYYVFSTYFLFIAYFLMAVLLFTVLKISYCNARFCKAFTDIICESNRFWVIPMDAYGISYNINSISYISNNLTFCNHHEHSFESLLRVFYESAWFCTRYQCTFISVTTISEDLLNYRNTSALCLFRNIATT